MEGKGLFVYEGKLWFYEEHYSSLAKGGKRGCEGKSKKGGENRGGCGEGLDLLQEQDCEGNAIMVRVCEG